METQHSRTTGLIGEENLNRLKTAKVLVFGVGGVGGHAIEALARAGIGDITIVDNDDINKTNINRQVIALHSTVGKNKVDVMQERIRDINPSIKVHAIRKFIDSDNIDEFDFENYDYIIDAIDNVTAKILIAQRCVQLEVPQICAMGAANKLGTSRFRISDISKTSVCPLARVIRKELKKRGISSGVKVCYSKEPPIKKQQQVPASISFVPAMAGLTIAGEVIRNIILREEV